MENFIFSALFPSHVILLTILVKILFQMIHYTEKSDNQKQPPEMFCKKRDSSEFSKINRKSPVPEPLF